MARKSRKNQIDQIKQTNDVMSAPKEEEGVTFCSDCGNRLTKADAKFCKKCGSIQ